MIHSTIDDYLNINYTENDLCRRAIDRENFRDALKDPSNRRERDQGDCNGKRDNGLKCT